MFLTKYNSKKPFLFPLILILIIYSSSIVFNFLIFHFIAEFFAIFVALCIGLIAYYTYPFTKNRYLLFLGLGYIWIGLLDLLHTLTFPGMNLFTVDGSNTTLTIWVLTRIFEATILLLAPTMGDKKFDPLKITILFLFIASFIFIISLFNPIILFIKGEGLTLLKTSLEYFIIFLLIITMINNKRHLKGFKSNVYSSVQLSIILTILAELSFTIYVDMGGLMIALGHTFKFLSFWVIFESIIKISLTKPMELLAENASSYNAIPIPAIVVSEDGTIRQTNKAAINSLNIPLTEIIGKSNHELFHQSDIKAENCPLCKSIKKHDFSNTFDLYDNKKETYTQYFLSPISTGNNNIGLIQASIDITEITKAKIKLSKFNEELQEMIYQRTEELEESNEELQCSINNLKLTQTKLVESEKMAGLGGLVAGVAHEINTPIGIGLTGITHLIYITENIKLKYESDEMTEKEFEKYIADSISLSNQINTNLDRTAQLVRSFKQVAVDQTSEIKREFSLESYLNGVLLSIKNIYKDKNIEIKVICDKNISLNSYPGTYSQIITNLVVNSVRHGFKNHEKGLITIEVKRDQNNINIIYKDNGKGIEKKNLKKIFDPFFTTNREAGGTGLGLNIIYNIITSTLKGTITTTSKINEGVIFKITLPITF